MEKEGHKKKEEIENEAEQEEKEKNIRKGRRIAGSEEEQEKKENEKKTKRKRKQKQMVKQKQRKKKKEKKKDKKENKIRYLYHCLLVGCLTSQQHTSVSYGWICSDNFTCCHTEIEAADQTFYLTQSQYTDTGLTIPSADPIMPRA